MNYRIAAQEKWCQYVAGMIGGWLEMDIADPRIKTIGEIIERRLWALERDQKQVQRFLTDDQPRQQCVPISRINGSILKSSGRHLTLSGLHFSMAPLGRKKPTVSVRIQEAVARVVMPVWDEKMAAIHPGWCKGLPSVLGNPVEGIA